MVLTCKIWCVLRISPHPVIDSLVSKNALPVIEDVGLEESMDAQREEFGQFKQRGSVGLINARIYCAH